MEQQTSWRPLWRSVCPWSDKQTYRRIPASLKTTAQRQSISRIPIPAVLSSRRIGRVLRTRPFGVLPEQPAGSLTKDFLASRIAPLPPILLLPGIHGNLIGDGRNGT